MRGCRGRRWSHDVSRAPGAVLEELPLGLVPPLPQPNRSTAPGERLEVSTEEISGAIHYAPALLMWLRRYSTLRPQVLLLGFSGLKNMKSVTFMQDFPNILVAKLADICPTRANQGLGNLTGRVGC